MIRNAFVRWYKHHVEMKLRDKVKRYSVMVGVQPSGIGVKSFKSRWGSCSTQGKIRLQLEDHYRSKPHGGLCGGA